MRKTLGVCLLVLLLTGSTRAGLIPNDTLAPPPPDQQTSSVQAPTDATQGQTTTDGEMTNDTVNSLTQTALDLLAALPSLL